MAAVVVKPNKTLTIGCIFADLGMTVTPELVAHVYQIPEECVMEPNGQLLRIDEYPELFAVVGKQYGGGPETFRLPNVKSMKDFIEAGEEMPTPAEIKEEIRRHREAHPDATGFG